MSAPSTLKNPVFFNWFFVSSYVRTNTTPTTKNSKDFFPMNKPTNEAILKCEQRFLEMCQKYGYARSVSLIRREFDADTVAAFETQGKRKPIPNEHGNAVANAEDVAAARQWDTLYARTEATQ